MATKKKADLNRTIADMDAPVLKESEGEKSPRAGRIDTVAMIKAWDLNVAAQRESIKLQQRIMRHLELAEAERVAMGVDYERARVDNRRTRSAMYAAGAALILTLGWIHHLGAESASRDAEIVRLITVQTAQVVAVRDAVTLVADSALAADDAATTAAAVAEAVADMPAPTRRRQTPEQVLAEVRHRKDLKAKRMAAREARLVASVKVTRASVRLAPDAPTKARAAVKLRRAEGQARAASLDVDAF